MAASGEAAEMIEAAKAGFTCAPQDAKALASTMKQAAALSRLDLARLGQNGRAYYDRHLSFAVNFKKVDEILHNVAKR